MRRNNLTDKIRSERHIDAFYLPGDNDNESGVSDSMSESER